MSSAEYYENPNVWGNYQYVTLNDVVNNYMAGRSSDDFTSLEPRHRVLLQARRGFRELYYDVAREIRAVELELSPLLNITVPPDFVNFVRISWVDEHGQLHPMVIDRSMSIAERYLQDNEYNILFDDEGCVLQDDGLSPQVDLVNTKRRGYNFCASSFQPNLDLSRVFKNGRFNFDRSSGVIQFGSEVFGKHIVLEYISDGIYTGCEGRPEVDIRIHKFAETAIMDFIYYELIKNRRNVPANEKARARKEFFNSRRIAK